jgi:hypothetical protein
MLWRMEQKGFNHQAWHWMNVNIMPFIFHHGELRFSHNVFVSSKWTQRIRFLVSFIALPWTTVLVRLQLHSSSTSKRVLWVHICMLKVCKNSSHYTMTFARQVDKWQGLNSLWCIKILSRCHLFYFLNLVFFYHVKTHLWMIMMESRILMV